MEEKISPWCRDIIWQGRDHDNDRRRIWNRIMARKNSQTRGGIPWLKVMIMIVIILMLVFLFLALSR